MLAARIKPDDRAAQDNYDLTVILLDTGARYDEIAGLKKTQVDLEAGVMSLYRPKVDNEGSLMLTRRSVAILKRRVEAIGFKSYLFPAHEAHGPGRSAWTKEDAGRGHATQAIQSAIEAAGLNSDPTRDRVTPHTFRDTYASRLVQEGVSLLKVSHLLGHADVAMTQKYAHLCPDNTGREAAAVLDRLHTE